ncbi:DUF4255 domain-containing protein [Oryzomicrobium sp.]|uniref:DUF4255 domain-containing protein n=1 Tax=Oryzomicrobium sp. TaxID=1911578 RepID=UPI0025EC9BDA|nr:DUF4255 domain-containing protein [Oryzomicrobium sp.]MCE1244193.1 DUF4255 domain-containing protein [Oryzomicrobium sp.]
MIHAALFHLAERLNESLSRGAGISEDLVVVSSLLEQDGTVSPSIANKLVLFLTCIEKDSSPASIGGGRPGAEVVMRRHLPVHLNLYVMVAANFGGGNYPEALKMISAAIQFFQKNPIFDHQTSPGLDGRIDKLILDIENLNRQDMANLWGVLSGKYLPSVLYRVRMITFDSQDVRSLEPAALGVETGLRTRHG